MENTGAGSEIFIPSPDEPVLTHGLDTDWYGSIVEPGAVIRHDEIYYMFFNGLEGWPVKGAIGLAMSEDGVSWQVISSQPLLDSAGEGFDGYTFFVSSVLQLDQNEWAMYLYTLSQGRDGAPGKILMAAAPALEGPWQLAPEPVLSPGEPGGWDGSRVTQPHVIRANGEYLMVFAGYENDRLQGARRIGLALSEDGYEWRKHPEPVLTFSDDPRTWDSFRVFQPRILEVAGGFWMFYKSNISVGRREAWGLAFSTDGMHWEKYSGNPVLDPQSLPIGLRRTGMADFISTDGRLVMYLEIMERDGGGYHHGNSDYRSNIFRFTALELP